MGCGSGQFTAVDGSSLSTLWQCTLRARLQEAEKDGEAMRAELQVLRTLLRDVADEADDAEADTFLLSQEEGR